MRCTHCPHPSEVHTLAGHRCRIKIGIGWDQKTCQFTGGYRDCGCPGYAGPPTPPVKVDDRGCPHEIAHGRCVHCGKPDDRT